MSYELPSRMNADVAAPFFFHPLTPGVISDPREQRENGVLACALSRLLQSDVRLYTFSKHLHHCKHHAAGT